MPISVIVSAGVAGLTSWVAGLATGAIITDMVIAAGIAAAQWLIQQHKRDPSKGGGGGIPSPAQRRAQDGIRVGSYVLGRKRLTNEDYQMTYIDTKDVGNGRRQLHIVHVLAYGPCEGIEKIWIDGTLAMTATPDGNNQFLEPDNTGWFERYEELKDEEEENYTGPYEVGSGNYNRQISVAALEELDKEDIYRFRAIQRTRTRSGAILVSDWGPWTKAYVYPNGIGSNPHADTADLPNWKDEYEYNGLCVVHMMFEKSNFDSPFTSIPRVEYQLKGLKTTWPGQSTPKWTENAAALRWWFHTQRRDFPAHRILEFEEAYNKCNEEISFTIDDPDDEYTKNVKRYTINGTVLADPSYNSQYIRQFDQAWQGFAVPSRGNILFRPGFDRPVAFNIGKENIIKSGPHQPMPSIADRVNAVRFSLHQSYDNDFIAYDLPVVKDDAAESRDGRYLEIDLESSEFIIYPLAAFNNMYIFLRRGRASARLSYQIQVDPMDLEENMNYPLPNLLDRVTVNDPEYGIPGTKWEIIQLQRLNDYTLRMQLEEAPDGRYADTSMLPPLKARRLTPPKSTTPPPAVIGAVATPGAEIKDDGGLFTYIDMTWEASSYAVEFTVENDDFTFEDEFFASVNSNRTRIPVPKADNYTITMRNVNQRLKRSYPSSVIASVTTDHLKPPTPTFANHEVRGQQVIFNFQALPQSNWDVNGLLIKFRRMDISTTTPFPATPTEAQFTDLSDLSIGAIVPSNDGGYSVTGTVPRTGRFKFYAKTISRQGLKSDIYEIPGEFILQGFQDQNITKDFQPAFPGTYLNVNKGPWSSKYMDDGQEYDIIDALVPDNSPASTVTLGEWNGVNYGDDGQAVALVGYPFGNDFPIRYSNPLAIELPVIGTYEVRAEINMWNPPAHPQRPQLQVQVQGYLNGTQIGTNKTSLSGPNSTVGQWQRFTGINQVGFRVSWTNRRTVLRLLRLHVRVVE